MRLTVCLLLAFLLTLPALAQPAGTFVTGEDSRLWIDGTSNKSDWTVTAEEMEGQFVVTLGEDGLPKFDEVSFSVPARRIVSGRSTIMDRLMYRTLKATAHPSVAYSLTSVESVTGTDAGWVLETTGTLSLAGAEKEIALTVTAQAADSDGYVLSGSLPLTMTEFGMDPPTAMFGALHTADEVSVGFEVRAVATD